MDYSSTQQPPPSSLSSSSSLPSVPPDPEMESPSLMDLPSNLLDEILIRLPIRSAVRTSSLSRPWRFRWHSLPELSLHGPGGERSPLHFAAIDHALLLHSAPFSRLSLCTSHASAHADRWLLSLSLRPSLPETLTSLSLSFVDRHLRFHPLHSSVFSFRALSSLRLFHCAIAPPPDFPGFPSLRSLLLHDVQIRADGHLHALLSRCPALEHLVLLYVRPCRSVRIPRPGPHTGSIEAENELADRFRSVVCTGLVCLHDITVQASAKASRPERGPTTFHRLRSLSVVVDLLDIRHVSLLIAVLKSACNLHKLSLTGLDYADDEPEHGEEFWKKQQGLDVFSSLRTAEIHDVLFRKFEMGLIRFILAKSSVLETLTISSPTRTDRRQEALTELGMFDKASTEVQIICKEQD